MNPGDSASDTLSLEPGMFQAKHEPTKEKECTTPHEPDSSILFRIEWNLQEITREISFVNKTALAKFNYEALEVFNFRVGVINREPEIVI